MPLPSVKKAKVKNKTVLLRADLDMPLTESRDQKGLYMVADDFRLSRALPTIRYLIKQKAKLIIAAHVGRPKGWDSQHSLRPIALLLAASLRYKFLEITADTQKLPSYSLPHVFFFSADFRSERQRELLADLNAADVAVLENLRFYEGENQNDSEFSHALASLADIFINDAFSSSYDERASVVGVANVLPHYAGLEFEREVAVLGGVLRRPTRPYVAMVGGIKLAEKLNGLRGLLEHCDHALVGGGLTTLFFAALGYQTGASTLDSQHVGEARELWRNFREKLLIPLDVVVARAPHAPHDPRVVAASEVGPGEMILDIGPRTIQRYSEVLKAAKTLVWSGPLGMFEVPRFAHGTKALGRLFASRSRGLAFGVAGGGNTLQAIRMTKMGEYIDFLSTGGTAMLQFLAGQELPGIEALQVKSEKFKIKILGLVIPIRPGGRRVS